MRKRKLYTNVGGRICVEDNTLRLIILDVLKELNEYFVDSEYITDEINEIYNENIHLQRVRTVINKMVKEGFVVMKHSIKDPHHKKYYSHPDNHPDWRI